MELNAFQNSHYTILTIKIIKNQISSHKFQSNVMNIGVLLCFIDYS